MNWIDRAIITIAILTILTLQVKSTPQIAIDHKFLVVSAAVLVTSWGLFEVALRLSIGLTELMLTARRVIRRWGDKA